MRVLLATDLSQTAPATSLVKAASWPSGSTIRAVCVLEPYPAFVGVTPELVMQFDDVAVKEVEQGLATIAGALERPGLTLEHEVLLGRPADQVVAEAREFGADLVVVGSRGRGPFASTLLGSVSGEIVDRSPCPVLVARTASLLKVIVAEDGSEGAREAVSFLARIPLFKGVPTQVVSVVDVPMPVSAGAEPPMLSEAVLDSYTQLIDAVRREAARDAATTAERLAEAGIPAIAATPREGNAAREIVAAAEQFGADLIVVGSRGHTGVARLVLGSVARSVLTHAHCSVLVVHRPHPSQAKPG